MKALVLTDYESIIGRLVSKYIDAEVEIVDSPVKYFKQKCSQTNVESLSEKLAIALWKSPVEPNRILLQNEIPEAEIENHMQALFANGFEDVYYLFENSRDFMLHLVLHEVAHIRHDWDQLREKACDQWAFDEFKKIKKESFGSDL